MADEDAQRYAQIASLAAGMVALLCLIAWLLRLSMLVRLISDSILVGFKAGAGLTIAMTQMPSLLGVTGGGHNFFQRAALLAATGRDQLPCVRARRRRDPATRAWRACFSGAAGGACGRCAIDRGGVGVRPPRYRGARHGRGAGGSAIP